MKLFEVFGGVGGVLLVLAATIAVGRGVFLQIRATEENTAAVNKLSEKFDQLAGVVGSHDTQIAVLKDRIRRQRLGRGRRATSAPDPPGHLVT